MRVVFCFTAKCWIDWMDIAGIRKSRIPSSFSICISFFQYLRLKTFSFLKFTLWECGTVVPPPTGKIWECGTAVPPPAVNPVNFFTFSTCKKLPLDRQFLCLRILFIFTVCAFHLCFFLSLLFYKQGITFRAWP